VLHTLLNHCFSEELILWFSINHMKVCSDLVGSMSFFKKMFIASFFKADTSNIIPKFQNSDYLSF